MFFCLILRCTYLCLCTRKFMLLSNVKYVALLLLYTVNSSFTEKKLRIFIFQRCRIRCGLFVVIDQKVVKYAAKKRKTAIFSISNCRDTDISRNDILKEPSHVAKQHNFQRACKSSSFAYSILVLVM